MFRVGQKVTMIEPWKQSPSQYGEVFTEFGEVYTVRENVLIGDVQAIRVIEIVNAAHSYNRYGMVEQPFPSWNFRPVVSRPTSIAIFQRLIAPSREKEAV